MLCVTSVSFRALAWPAINTSYDPIGVPFAAQVRPNLARMPRVFLVELQDRKLERIHRESVEPGPRVGCLKGQVRCINV